MQNSSRKCRQCKTVKPLSEFNRHGPSPEGRRLRCSRCTSMYQKLYRVQNPSKVAARERSKNLRRYYGINPEEYDKLLTWSDGGCAICGAKKGRADLRLYIDHDHTTGMVRGLLCNQCNQGLGNFRDDVRLLKIAIAYLEYFKV